LQFTNLVPVNLLLCGDNIFQPSLSAIISFASSLFSTFLLRSVLDTMSKMILRKITKEPNPRSLKQFAPGAYEFHVIKTGYLGLCQACGLMLSVAIYGSCPCGGWLAFAAWALSMTLLLSIPFGFLGLAVSWYMSAFGTKQIRFIKKSSNVKSEYFRSVMSAKGSVGDACRPAVIHAIFKTIFAAIGAACAVYGITAISVSNPWPAVILLSLGALFLLLARVFSASKFGRSAVVALTNKFAALSGERYVLEKKVVKFNLQSKKMNTFWIIRTEDNIVPSGRGCFYSLKFLFMSALSFFNAKLEAISDQKMLDSLRSRGRWKKSDSLRVFYEEFTTMGFYFHMFLLIKHLLIGLLITSDPPLASSLVKVKR
jgi:membrane protein implicated in regulation of membrane protease activity